MLCLVIKHDEELVLVDDRHWDEEIIIRCHKIHENRVAIEANKHINITRRPKVVYDTIPFQPMLDKPDPFPNAT